MAEPAASATKPPPPLPRTAGSSASSRTSPHVVGEVERHLLPHGLGDVLEVGPVALRQDDRGEPGPLRREHLLLDAADRQHPTLERDLAGHPDVGAHRAPGEQAGTARWSS